MTAVDFSGVTLPFTPADLLNSGMGLVGVIGGFVLLALAFVIVPKVIGLVRGSIGGGKSRA